MYSSQAEHEFYQFCFFFFLEWIICYFFKCVYCIIPIVYRPNYFASWISANFCFNKNFSYKWIYTKASLNSDGWKFRSKLFLTSKMNHCQDVNWKFWTHHSNYRPWWRQKIVKTFFLKNFPEKSLTHVPKICQYGLIIGGHWFLLRNVYIVFVYFDKFFLYPTCTVL